jgi:hypothetical protein
MRDARFADRDQIEHNRLLSASVVEEIGLDGVLDVFAPAGPLPTYARGSRRVADAIRRSSYRNGFAQHPLPRAMRQVSRRQKVHRHAE